MIDESAFLADLPTNPLDDELRRVHADWLEAQGDVRREVLPRLFWRKQIEKVKQQMTEYASATVTIRAPAASS